MLTDKIYRTVVHQWQLLKRKFPYRVQCNICGWKGRHFSSDLWHWHSRCPLCRSHVRHRLLLAALTTLDELHSRKLIEGKRILHFAPETIIFRFFSQHAKKYVSADLEKNNTEWALDMCDMHEVPDSSFDLVVACDVLEHVADDAKAISEIYRVLTDNGYVILTVPQKDNLSTKLEDSTITDPDERERIFGQHDHLRIYGDDFKFFLESVGFFVIIVDENNFPTTMVRKNVLFPPKLSNHPLATNYRKVYFGQKKK